VSFGDVRSDASCLLQIFSYYKALTFYLQEQPTLLTDLPTVLIPRIDHSRVVRMFKQIDHIPLIRSYLIRVTVQHEAFLTQKPEENNVCPSGFSQRFRLLTAVLCCRALGCRGGLRPFGSNDLGTDFRRVGAVNLFHLRLPLASGNLPACQWTTLYHLFTLISASQILCTSYSISSLNFLISS
jgi:hypothetical protein